MSGPTTGPAGDSVPVGVPADGDDLRALCGTEDPADWRAMSVPGHMLWDNGMYVEVDVHLGMGRWVRIGTEEAWRRLPAAVRHEYVSTLGREFPAPGWHRAELRRRFP